MTPSSNTLARLGAAALLALGAACGDFERGEPDDTQADAGDTDAGDDGGQTGGLSYATDVHPILTTRCGSCHSTGAGGSFNLAADAAEAHTTVLTLVDTSAPADSTLLKKGTGETGHGGGAALPKADPDYTTILNWITEGAAP